MECATAYRNQQLDLSDSNSSDSDDDCDVWKRHSKPDNPIPPPPLSPPPQLVINKKKINNIWSSVLLEQTVAADLEHCGLEKQPIGLQDRQCESYDFTRKQLDNRPTIPEPDADMDSDYESCIAHDLEEDYKEPPTKDAKKRFNDFKKDGESKQKSGFFFHRKKHFVRLNKHDSKIALKIARTLNERKIYLIFRVVRVLGPEKAMQLLKMTEDVEESGGMMIKNQSRKRTPGGVFLQLLKSEKDVTKEQINEIFEEEMSYEDSKKLAKQRKKQNQKKMLHQLEVTMTENAMDVAVPNTKDVAPENAIEKEVPEIQPPTVGNGHCQSSVDTVVRGDSDVEDGEILD